MLTKSFGKYCKILKSSKSIVTNSYKYNKVCCHPTTGDKERTPLINLTCKNAVIIGGGGEIGRATAHNLLCNKVNQIALLDIDPENGVQSISKLNSCFGKHKSIFVNCDVTDKKSIADTIWKLKHDMSPLEVFVHCAGYWNEKNSDRVVSVNVAGTINTNLAVIKAVPHSNAVIINLAGFPGLDEVPSSPIFAAAQSAIIKFSTSLGHDINYKRFGVRIITLCMGITETDFIKSLDQKMLTPAMGKELMEFIDTMPSQKTRALAQAITTLIKYGKNGSTWVVEDSKLFCVQPTNWRNRACLVTEYTS